MYSLLTFQIRDILVKASQQLVELAKQHNHFSEPPPEEYGNNSECRVAAQIAGPGHSLIHMSDMASTLSAQKQETHTVLTGIVDKYFV